MGSAGDQKTRPQKLHNLDATIPKKKQKGKKIVAGNTLGITSTPINQVNSSASWQTRDYKVPWKPNRSVTPEKNRQSSNSKKKNVTNHNNSRWTKGKNWNNESVKSGTSRQVLGTLPKDVDAKKVREALNSKDNLPERFKDACRDTTLELNESGDFIVPKRANCMYFRRVLPKCKKKGFLDWLQGQTGWIIDTNKAPFLRYFRELHEVYDVKVRTLMKHFDKDKATKSALRLLYYKDPLTLTNGQRGSQQSTNQQTLWKKVSETQSLDAGVGMIRPFLEVVRYFCIGPREKWTSLPWLIPAITLEESQMRIPRIENFVKILMRNSDWGPDAPVHWAAHPPRNAYPLTMVTEETMTELVVGLANILSHLFLPKPRFVNNLEQVDRMLKSPSWTESSPRGSNFTATANNKASPKNTKKMTSSKHSKKAGRKTSNRNPRAPSSNSVDDIVIDLTGLSIDD